MLLTPEWAVKDCWFFVGYDYPKLFGASEAGASVSKQAVLWSSTLETKPLYSCC